MPNFDFLDSLFSERQYSGPRYLQNLHARDEWKPEEKQDREV